MRSRERGAPTEADVRDLLRQARSGSSWAVGRLLTLTEDGESARVVAGALPVGDPTAPAHVIGVTGPPGAGKSTTVSALVGAMRADGLRIAVLAVDPSSPFSGGALLGDRARMRAHATDPHVFIRSMASRGQLGGLSRATPIALRVFEASGFDVVLLETVGVGQSEVDVVRAADTVMVVSAPGMGDDLQAMKAGILEIADVYVVNKADHPEARQLVRQLRQTASLAQTGAPPGSWRRPVVSTVATAGDVADLVTALSDHRSFLGRDGELARRRRMHVSADLRAAAASVIDAWLAGPDGRSTLDQLAAAVASGDTDEWSATRRLIARFTSQFLGAA